MIPELLCPAGGFESIQAAVLAGADAVYLGGPKFSARAYATNFTNEDLFETIQYCKKFNVKVYITINTLLKEGELFEAYEYAIKVWNMGVDAIIIQDTGLIALLRKNHPQIELHASTQMTIHNKKGAQYLVQRGIKRVVLSRELTLADIEDISQEVETEVFIHGALCISYSGKCLMSSFLGGRSGNRGRCAQNCRRAYELKDEKGQTKAQGFLLSPKDLSTIDLVEDFEKIGVASLKIEGRMKRPEYVYEIASQYRKALNGETYEEEPMRQIFNRQGFTKAFLVGDEGKDMMAYESPKNTGVFLGKAMGKIVKLARPVHLGDGLSNGQGGFIVTKIVRGKKEVSQALAGEEVILYPSRYRQGDELYKTSDSLLEKELRERLKQKPEKRRKVTIQATFQEGHPFSLSLTSGMKHVSLTGPVVEAVKTKPTTKEQLTEKLSKIGSTPFILEELQLAYGQGFLPLSVINELRRQAFAELERLLLDERREKTLSPKEYKAFLQEAPNPSLAKDGLPKNLISMTLKEQLKAYQEEISPDQSRDFAPCLDLYKRPSGSLRKEDALALSNAGYGFFLKAPEILQREFVGVLKEIKELSKLPGFLGVTTDNAGVLEELQGVDFPLVGDSKFNFYNSLSPSFYDNLSAASVSGELTKEEISHLVNKKYYYVNIYGRRELMHSAYCPIGSTVGGKDACHGCNRACERQTYELKDEVGERFPIGTDLFCRSTIYHSQIENNLDQRGSFEAIGFEKFSMDLTKEDNNEARSAIHAFKEKKGLTGISDNRGHFLKGVE